jgi:hypothetical protein
VTRHPSALTISKTVYNSLPQLFSPSHADSLPSLMIGVIAKLEKIHLVSPGAPWHSFAPFSKRELYGLRNF